MIGGWYHRLAKVINSCKVCTCKVVVKFVNINCKYRYLFVNCKYLQSCQNQNLFTNCKGEKFTIYKMFVNCKFSLVNCKV